MDLLDLSGRTGYLSKEDKWWGCLDGKSTYKRGSTDFESICNKYKNELYSESPPLTCVFICPWSHHTNGS